MVDFNNFKLGQLTGALYTGGVSTPPNIKEPPLQIKTANAVSEQYSGINTNIKNGDYISCQTQMGINPSGYSRWIA